MSHTQWPHLLRFTAFMPAFLMASAMTMPTCFGQEAENQPPTAAEAEVPAAEVATEQVEDAPPTEEPTGQTPAEPAAEDASEAPAGTTDESTGEAAEETAAEETAPAGPAAKAFDSVFAEWKSLLKELRDLKLEAQIADDATLKKLQSKWDALILSGREMEPKLRSAALDAYEEAPNADRELVRYLITVASDMLRADDYESAKKLATVLVDNKSEEKELHDIAGISAFGCNDYVAAEEHLKAADEEGTISSQGSKFLSQVAQCKIDWEKEQEIREAEAAADDLPRVKLSTDVGDIVVELFENEAPETVGNFISLVEKGFYDGLSFHRVLEAFMAQGGCPNGDGSGGPGYNIYCECVDEGYRKHFAGSLSMAKQQARNTGGCQFFITYVSTSFLDGQHTVFGRVVEGLDVLPKIVKRNPEGAPPLPVATKIEKATVVRKRDHDYRPNKVG